MTNVNGLTSGYVQGGNTIDMADVAKPPHAKPSQIATGSSDAADLSGMGSLLASAVTSTDDVRADIVESLRAAINNGTYQVSAGDVADTMLKNMLG